MNHPLQYWRGSLLSPFRDNQFQRAVDRLFEDWSESKLSKSEGQVFNPSCEVTESKADYTVKFDVPGLSKDQIKIELHDGFLTVTGERREEKKEDDKKRHFSEVSYGMFTRSLSFPTQVSAERVEAKYDSGVLTITIPKAETTKSRQVTIK